MRASLLRASLWSVDVVGGDPYITGTLTFSATVASLSEDKMYLYIDCLRIESDYGFRDLERERYL